MKMLIIKKCDVGLTAHQRFIHPLNLLYSINTSQLIIEAETGCVSTADGVRFNDGCHQVQRSGD